MSVPVVVIGAGGFGRETLDVLEAVNAASSSAFFEIIGVVDDLPSEQNQQRLAARKIAWLGSLDTWLSEGDESRYVIAIGDPKVRSAISSKLIQKGRIPVTAIHPDARIGSQSIVGEGSVICGGAQISTNVSLGRHVHVNPNATIGHDSRIDDIVSINPGVIVSGEVRVGRSSLLGAGCVILQGLSLGPSTIVGASACVTKDVAGGLTVKGVPAR